MNISSDPFSVFHYPSRQLSSVNLTSGKYLDTSASEQEVTEWIVFGFSIASFALILTIVIYELVYPLYMKKEWREKTLIEYTSRYNREEYDRIRPDLTRRAAAKTPVYVMPSAADIRKSIGATFGAMFKAPTKYVQVL